MSKLRAALEEAIGHDFTDRAAHSAYADLLQDEGDPRGEFIQIQLALEDPACVNEERARLKEREAALLAKHQIAWLGQLSAYVGDRQTKRYQYDGDGRCGWARLARWVSLYRGDVPSLRAVMTSPAARFLQRLSIETMPLFEDPEEEVERLSEDEPGLPHLRRLCVGEEVDFDEETYDSNGVYCQYVEDLLRLVPRLRQLRLFARPVDMAELFALDTLPELRELILYHNRGEHPLTILAKNPAFAALETLRIHPAHSPEGESYLPCDQVAALVRSPHLRALTNLHLHASDLGDRGCRAIVKSGILKRLEVLDLRHGRIGDEGVRLLTESPDFAHVRLLRLEGNEIGDEVCGEIETLFGEDRVDINCQNEAGTDAYLFTGDME